MASKAIEFGEKTQNKFHYAIQGHRGRYKSKANITVSDISLKTTFFGLHFRRRKYRCIFNHYYIIRPKATEFGEITVPLGLLRRSRSFKVTDFGTVERSYTTSY